MTVSQTGKTTNSVTITVNGMPDEYDRQTVIRIPGDIHSSGVNTLCSLSKAETDGYITGYTVADFNKNNGDITVEISEEYTDKYPVWKFYVRSLLDKKIISETVIYTVLSFRYDGRKSKIAGETIDITVRDLTVLNRFGAYINAWIGETSSSLSLKGSVSGDPIYADFLRIPAEWIYNNAHHSGVWAADIMSYTSDIVSYCTSGEAFRADYFNGIQEAINLFAMTVSD